MELVYLRPELTPDEVACLRTAPHKLHALTNVAPGAPYSPIAALARMGYLSPVKKYVGRYEAEDLTEYDLTDDGLAAIGGTRPRPEDNARDGIAFPDPKQFNDQCPRVSHAELDDAVRRVAGIWPWW